LTIEEGRAVEQAGAIEIIEEMENNRLKKSERKRSGFYRPNDNPRKAS
jgi:hypothetical protein